MLDFRSENERQLSRTT